MLSANELQQIELQQISRPAKTKKFCAEGISTRIHQSNAKQTRTSTLKQSLVITRNQSPDHAENWQMGGPQADKQTLAGNSGQKQPARCRIWGKIYPTPPFGSC
jgi:coproporphyrinogen III oxidase